MESLLFPDDLKANADIQYGAWLIENEQIALYWNYQTLIWQMDMIYKNQE